MAQHLSTDDTKRVLDLLVRLQELNDDDAHRTNVKPRGSLSMLYAGKAMAFAEAISIIDSFATEDN